MLEDIGNLMHGFDVLRHPCNLGYMVVGILFGVSSAFCPASAAPTASQFCCR